MGLILFIGLVILVVIGLLVGFGFLIYFVTIGLGSPKTAKYITVVYGVIVLTIGFFIAFEDQLFTKSSAKELVEEQDFLLIDEFKILNNESSSAIGDYYHTFTLKISERDKQDAISRIKSSKGFIVYASADRSVIDSILYSNETINPYQGPKVTQNYETKNSYSREFFQPSGHEGRAPTFRRISISKTNNELKFEDINE